MILKRGIYSISAKLIFFFFAGCYSLSCLAQTNAEQVMTIGRNIMSMEDYLLAIQYFNQAIKAKPYLSDPYYYRAIAKLNLDDLSGALEDVDVAISKNAYKPDQYRLRGYLYQIQGKDSLAISDYDKGIELNPTDRYLFFYKGLALLDENRLSEADTLFNDLTKRFPKFDDAFTAYGKVKLAREDTVKAIENIHKAIEITKSQVNPYLILAEIEWSRKNWGEAGKAIDEAIRLKPESPELYINRAFIRYNEDDFDGAMEDYNYCLSLDPDNTGALFNRGLLRYEVKDLNSALSDFSHVIDLEPDNFFAIYNRGLVNLEMNKSRDAIRDFNKIIAKYPKFYPVYYALAEAYREIGNLLESGKYIRQADTLVEKYIEDPDKNKLDRPVVAPAVNNRINSTEEEDTEEETIEKFNRLMTVSKINDNEIPFSEKIKGRVQDRNVIIEPEPLFAISFAEGPHNLKSVSNYFREIDELNRSHLVSDSFYLSAGLQSEDFSDQLPTLFDKAEKTSAIIEKGSIRPVDYLANGVYLMMIGNPQKAIESLGKAIVTNPRFLTAYMARGYAKYMLANYDKGMQEQTMLQNDSMNRHLYESLMMEAIEDFDNALAINPSFIYGLYNKGSILYILGDYVGAEDLLKKAVSINPEFGEAWFNLGLALLQQGKKTDAFNSLSKAGEYGIIASYNIIKRMQ